MPTGLYFKGREGFLNGDIDWTADTIQVVLIDTTAYTVDLANDVFLSSVPAPARIGGPLTLAAKTSTDGIADASDVLFVALVGPPCGAFLVFQWTGLDATSRLIMYDDSALGLPVFPVGTNVTIEWSNDPTRRIFKL